MVDYQNVNFAIISLGEDDYSSQIVKEMTPIDALGDRVHDWHVSNKYFNADVKSYSCKLEEFKQNMSKFSKLDAVLLMFNISKNDVLKDIKELDEYFQSESPDLRMIWENSNTLLTDDQRENIMSWCLEHQFEFIDNEDSEDEDEEEGDFKEKYGSERIIEALKSHMWTNHVMKDETENKATDDPNIDFEGQLLQDGESFEELFGRLHAMKEKAENLDGDARKDYAEKVAYAFMEALGIDEEGSDDGGGGGDREDR